MVFKAFALSGKSKKNLNLGEILMTQNSGAVAQGVTVEGFVVQLSDGRFLSRKMRSVRHRDKKTTLGVERAWVHTGDELRANPGDWAQRVDKVFPAKYTSWANQTTITGESRPYDEVFV